MIEFRRPIPSRPVEIALVDGRPIAKASYYFASERWLVTSLGAGLNLGGTHGHPGVRSYKTIRQARRAIEDAWSLVK